MHHWYNNTNSQLDSTMIILLIMSISSTCFGRQFRPSSGALDCVYSWCYNAPTMLPAGLYYYEGKSLNNRNFILKCMENYAQGKILFRYTKWLLSNMSYRGRDDEAVWACAVGRTTWPLHCQLAPWKSNEALFVFLSSEGVKRSEIYRKM